MIKELWTKLWVKLGVLVSSIKRPSPDANGRPVMQGGYVLTEQQRPLTDEPPKTDKDNLLETLGMIRRLRQHDTEMSLVPGIAVNRMIDFVKMLDEDDLFNADIFPTECSSLQIERRNDEDTLYTELEIFVDRNAFLLDANGEMDELPDVSLSEATRRWKLAWSPRPKLDTDSVQQDPA